MVSVVKVKQPMTVDVSSFYTIDDVSMPIDSFTYDEYTVSNSSSVSNSESFNRVLHGMRTFSESLIQSDDKKLNVNIPFREKTVHVLQSQSKNIDKLYFETQINGATMRSQSIFDRFIMENVEPLETPLKSIYRRFSENFNLTDDEKWNFGKNTADSLKNVDSFNRIWKAKKKLYETQKLSDKPILNISVNAKENLMGSDLRLAQSAECVLSDICIGANGMTEDEFNEVINKPIGYTTFQEYKVGTYDYQDAIYRLVIRKNSLSANPLIYDYKIHVDIDDVKDKGTVSVPAEETKIYFNRTYYTTPDVVVNVVGGVEGSVVVPVITETSGKDDGGRYFKVVLKDATGQAVAGIITWNSTGY